MKHDIANLELIIRYCEDVESDMTRFGDDIEDFIGDRSYQRSTAKSIELIGERAKRLSDDVTSRFKDINWHDVCKMRDFMAHQYEDVDLEIQWSTMKSDLPCLKQYCRDIVAILESETDDEDDRWSGRCDPAPAFDAEWRAIPVRTGDVRVPGFGTSRTHRHGMAGPVYIRTLGEGDLPGIGSSHRCVCRMLMIRSE